jgi:predicted amidohydrolase
VNADQLRVALVQMQATVGETAANVDRARELARSAAEHSPDLVVLPEFFNTGYFPLYWDYNNMKLAEREDGETVAAFRELARELETHIAVPFYELEAPGLYYDTTVIVAPDGKTVAKYRKTHPPARISLEKLYYRGASRLTVFDVAGWKLGILICYDNYLAEPARAMMVQGASFVIAPFAEVADFKMWLPLLQTRAFENGIYVAACNLVGPDRDKPTAIMGGRSVIIDPEGDVLTLASDTSEDIVYADLTMERLIEVRSRRQFLRDRRPELYEVLTRQDEDARQLGN